MRSTVAGIAIGLALGGCAGPRVVPLDQASHTQLRGRTSSVVHREMPSFSAATPGKASFALVGAFAMLEAGDKIVKEDGIEDPAVRIGEELLQALASGYAMRIVGNAEVATTAEVPKLAQLYPMADLVLDVQTVSWSFVYFPTNWTHYRVVYNVQLHLIDTKRSALLADGHCERVPAETRDAPTYDQLLEDHGARLKQELKAAAEHCIGELGSRILRLS